MMCFNDRLGIVILNYENYDETINCVESIESHNILYKYIVIVDNGSKNQSVSILNSTFDKKNIIVLSSEKNLGFAQGNNIGIRYLREMRQIDFVLLLNSDTEIMSAQYVDDLLKEYKKGIAVIGSFVKMPRGVLWGGEKEDLSFSYSLFQALKLFFRLYYYPFPFVYLKKNEKELRIHGCAIMLTPEYFKHYKMLWPFTFLYREEMILSILCKKAKIKVAVSNAVIWHKVGGSSGELGYSSREKRRYDHLSAWQQTIVSLLPYRIIKMILSEC